MSHTADGGAKRTANAVGGWRAAVKALQAALGAESNAAELLQATAEISLLLADVTRRAGGGAQADVADVAADAGRPTSSSSRDVGGSGTSDRLLKGMDVDLNIDIDEVKASSKSIRASVKGTWKMQGKLYDFSVWATEVKGKIKKGCIDIAGLGFKAAGDLEKGSFGGDAEVLQWGQLAGAASMSAQSLRCAVVPALESLARKKATGVADFDVLDVPFRLMKRTLGLAPASAAAEEEAVAAPAVAASAPSGASTSRRRLGSKQSLQKKGLVDPEKAAEECAAAAVEEELRLRPSVKRLRDEFASLHPGASAAAAGAAAGSVQASSTGHDKSVSSLSLGAQSAEADVEPEMLDAFVVKAKSIRQRRAKDTKAAARKQAAAWADDSSGDERLGRQQPNSQAEAAAAGSEDGRAASCSEMAAGDSSPLEPVVCAVSEEDCSGTEFVGQLLFKAMKTKLEQGGTPTNDELLKMFDTDALPEDADLVTLDLATLGEGFSDSGRRAAALKALVQKQGGLREAALAFVAAEVKDAEEENGEDAEEGGEEEALEEDEEEDPSEDEEDEASPPVVQKKRRTH
eukprot:TRINITY_DN11938_c0_g1_i1.p1 TRINITY_DN11938_c0_g1~~TRINITY_DN11938_c0_g1_i1.p1  ORF type:complete len:584 (-),score=211.23 TRINITY_DN11938_c0_g1_i1:12-1730(-)